MRRVVAWKVGRILVLLLTTTVFESSTAAASRAALDASNPKIALPSIPARRFNIRNYGAAGDGRTLDTDAIERAVAAAVRIGGGTIIVPAGRYLTRPFRLVSRIDLHVEKGATLLLTTDAADYNPRRGNGRHGISAERCTDIAVTGKGTIDGQGGAWWPRYVKTYAPPAGAPPLPPRPYLVFFQDCDRILVKDVTLTNSPSFHLVPNQCSDVTVRNVHVLAPYNSPNTDGMDPCGRNFLITGCTFDVGDDCIALKPSPRARNGRPSCENFLIEHCRFLHGHGMSVGSQTAGGLVNMCVRNCTFDGTNAAIRLKSDRDRGGLVENLTYERLRIRHVKNPILISSYYPRAPRDPGSDAARPVTATTPVWRHIRLRRIDISDSPQAGEIVGLPEMPIEDLELSQVRISAGRGLRVTNARAVRFAKSQIRSAKGPALTLDHAFVSGIDPVTGR